MSAELDRLTELRNSVEAMREEGECDARTVLYLIDRAITAAITCAHGIDPRRAHCADCEGDPR